MPLKGWIRLKGEKLPYPGGFNSDGNLTDNPGEIEASRRILPMGYWKGTGFAILLDLISALLSGGKSTATIDRLDKGSCGSCCQVFIAINPLIINTQHYIDQVLDETLQQLKTAVPATDGGKIYYPGEQSLITRKENLEYGIPVDDSVWATVMKLADSV